MSAASPTSDPVARGDGPEDIFWRSRDVALELVAALPLEASQWDIEALAEKVRAEAASHPEGRAMALAAADHLGEAMVRRRVVARRPRRYGGGGSRGGNRVLFTMTATVTRFQDQTGRTLYFSFEGGQRRAARARHSFIDPENMPEGFDGNEGVFQLEHVAGRPWPFWRAVFEVKPPDEAVGTGGNQ